MNKNTNDHRLTSGLIASQLVYQWLRCFPIVKGGTLLLSCLLLSIFPPALQAQNFDEIIKAVASDRSAGDNFGWSVSISGDYAIVGAPFEDEGTSIVNNAGAAYIFERGVGGTWTEVQKLVASDRTMGDRFGYSVSISGDYAIVGAPLEDEDAMGGNNLNLAGSAYIFERGVGGTWTEVQKLVASDRSAGDSFGWSVSISGDFAIVGAWLEDEDAMGMNTQSEAGAAYIFERTGSTWTEVQKLVASDREVGDQFGVSVSISGDYAIVGAPLEDEDAGGGNNLNLAGSAYIFERNTSGTWTEVQKLVASDRAPNDNFGWSVSISGDYAIVGALAEDEDAGGVNTANNAGSAYIFERGVGGMWTEVQKLVASDRAQNDNFGWSVSISGDYAIVGARFEDEDAIGGNTQTEAGAAYIFARDAMSGTWGEVQKLVASDRAQNDNFGWSVSISGDYAIVGAWLEDEDALGGNPQNDAGAAYFFGPPFTAQLVQVCDGGNPNEGLILYVTAEGVPNWEVRNSNDGTLYGSGTDGALIEVSLSEIVSIEVVETGSPGNTAQLINLVGSPTSIDLSDDDGTTGTPPMPAPEGSSDAGCQNELICPTASAFDLIALGLAGEYSSTNPGGLIGANSLTGPHNGNFNAVILGSFTSDGSGDTEGRLAVRNDMTVNGPSGSSFTVGGGAPTDGTSGTGGLHAPQGFDNLVVGGDLDHPFVGIRGNVLYNTATNLPAFGAKSFSNASGIYRNATPDVDWAAIQTYYQGLSTDLSTCANGTFGTVTDNGGGNYELDGLDAGGVVIFDIPDLSPVAPFTGGEFDFVNIEDASTVIVNVPFEDIDATFFNVAIEGTVRIAPYTQTPIVGSMSEVDFIEKTIWNIRSATMNLSSANILGSVLAVNLTGSPQLNGGQINGQVVMTGDVQQSTGFEFHNFCFTGDFSACDGSCALTIGTVTEDACNGGTTTTMTVPVDWTNAPTGGTIEVTVTPVGGGTVNDTNPKTIVVSMGSEASGSDQVTFDINSPGAYQIDANFVSTTPACAATTVDFNSTTCSSPNPCITKDCFGVQVEVSNN